MSAKGEKINGEQSNIYRLPFRYLGVPLLAKKLGVGDCQVHIDKVEERINNWRNKNLSYAGIIQLIASVLSLMQIYWASVYLLPITVINDLEKLFKKFLWNAGDSAKGKARVALKMIIEDQNSLWAKWVNIVKLKEKNVWNINVDKSDSWGLKNMMRIRDEVRNHVWYEIGNGRKISVWYDKWCTDGPLSIVISREDMYDARLDDDAKVADMIKNDRTVNLTDRDDKVLWIINDGKKLKFVTKQAWEDLRFNWPIDKLLTQDKIDKWQQGGDLKCGFCKQCGDSMHHLFFQCDVTKKIWREMLKFTYKMDVQLKLLDVVDVLASKNGNRNIGNVINKMVLAATVYIIWQERNCRLFRGESRNEEVIIKAIYESVRSKLMSVRVNKSLRASVIARKWDLQWKDYYC
ncbi:RNA-directed DNA polymerase, eukaryota, reverse transcriptase zinc-binding domain protein [Tanacetum coccineum]